MKSIARFIGITCALILSLGAIVTGGPFGILVVIFIICAYAASKGKSSGGCSGDEYDADPDDL